MIALEKGWRRRPPAAGGAARNVIAGIKRSSCKKIEAAFRAYTNLQSTWVGLVGVDCISGLF